MTRIAWLWPVCLLFLYSSEAAKVLVVFSFPGKSHGILGHAVVSALAEAGHEVTHVTSFPEKKLPPNVTQIDVSETLALFPSDMINIKSIMNNEVSKLDMTKMFDIMNNVATVTIENVGVQKLANDPTQTFDVIIYEWMFTEFYAGLAAVFDCPYILFSSNEPHWVVLELIDEALNPAYNADVATSYKPPYSFTQRVANLFMQIFLRSYKYFFMTPGQVKEYDRVFGPLVTKRGRTLPPFDDLRYNASLMLGNSHVSLGEVTRLPQNYKPIGGYHINDEVKPLPEDLQKLMDGTEHGVIYFSMGSTLKSKDMPATLKRGLLNMFGELKYTVIWKFEEKITDVPKNVRILQWAPQQSLLSHPNCILFITHGGLLSTTETVHYAVPVIGIPVFADQFININRAVMKGIAKRVDLSTEMPEVLKSAIEEVTGNQRYIKTAKELSFIYHDRPVSPRAELVHWVEHVVRTRGAPHLRSTALMVPWYQKMYLDLAALLVTVLIVLRIALKRLFSFKKRVDIGKKNE